MLPFSELLSHTMAGHPSAAVTRVVVEYVLFGLAFGVTALAIPPAARRRLLSYGMNITLMTGAYVVGSQATVYLTYADAKGLIYSSDSVRTTGVPVFLDRGFGPVVRLTTDSNGLFLARHVLDRRGNPKLLICAPGGMPRIAWPLHDSLTVYRVVAMAPGTNARHRLWGLGWLREIPRECQAGDSDDSLCHSPRDCNPT